LDTFDVVTFGESMIRLSTEAGERLETATRLDMRIGGTESNLAIALARLGRSASWASVLPRSPLGQRVARELRWHGVDISAVQWVDDARMGVYYLEPGATPRPTRVTYDRRDSAVSLVDPESIDPDIVTNARVLHLTGITPALSENCAAVVDTLIATALDHNVPISFDLNYRSLLWTPERASTRLALLCEQASVLFCGQDDAATVWSLTGASGDVARGLAERFDPEVTVVTLGEEGALARTRDGTVHRVSSIPVSIVDQVGAGDAFAAGFLDGYLDGDIERGLRQGVAVAALKMTMNGDLALISRAEVDALLTNRTRAIVR
jgi:2-dehydro-3-deoxygluconokinase